MNYFIDACRKMGRQPKPESMIDLYERRQAKARWREHVSICLDWRRSLEFKHLDRANILRRLSFYTPTHKAEARMMIEVSKKVRTFQ